MDFTPLYCTIRIYFLGILTGERIIFFCPLYNKSIYIIFLKALLAKYKKYAASASSEIRLAANGFRSFREQLATNIRVGEKVLV